MRTSHRWLVTTALAIPLALVIAGCAGSSGTSGTGGGSSDSPYGGALGTPDEEAAFEALYQSAIDAGQNQVVVYGPTPSKAYTDAFMERFPDVEVIYEYLLGPDRSARLEAEKASGNFVGDVIAGGGPPLVNMALNGWCARTDPIVDIPDTMISTDNMVLLPQIALFGMVVNTDLVKPEAVPHTWEQLTDPKWKGKITMVTPSVGSSPLAFLLTPQENAMTWGMPILKGLHDNVTTVAQDSLTVSSVVDGTYPIGVLTPFQRYWQTKKDVPNAPISFDLVDEGNIWSADASCQLKNSPNPLAAQLWLNWTLSIEGQTVNSETGALPTRPGIPSPGGLPPVSEISLIPVLDPQAAITGYIDFNKQVQALFGN